MGGKSLVHFPRMFLREITLHFHASLFLQLFEFSQVPRQNFEDVRTYWQEDVLYHRKNPRYSVQTLGLFTVSAQPVSSDMCHVVGEERVQALRCCRSCLEGK